MVNQYTCNLLYFDQSDSLAPIGRAYEIGTIFFEEIELLE
jgi:hypothetical protein